MSYTDFVQEVYRAYDVLGEQAEFQNRNDIQSWLKDGLISEINAIELNRLNHELYVGFVLEML